MSRCWTLIAWANTFGRSDCAGVLKANLNEEEAADKNSRSLNRAAA
jgi:ferritin-like metal-binding protein YciE